MDNRLSTMERFISSLSTEQKNLVKTVQNGTLKDVKVSLSQFPKFNEDATFSYVLLLVSIRRKHKSISSLLIKKKCKVRSSFKTNYFNTPLYSAMRRNDVSLFEELYKNGASLCDCDANSETPLEFAMKAWTSHFWDLIASKLKFDELDPSCQEHVAIFHVACYKGNAQLVKKFKDRQFSVNSRSHFQGPWAGATPLHFASKSYENTYDVVKFLLQLDVDFNIQNEQGDTPLLSTVTIKVNPRDPDDRYVDDIFKQYVRRFKHFNNPVNKCGLSHFHLLCSLNWDRDDLDDDETKLLKVLRSFIENKVDINSANHYKSKDDNGDVYYAGYTALHWAAQKSSPRVLELLLENGADPTKVDLKGQTPLHTLEFKGPQSVRMTELLLKYGADVDAKDSYGQTSIHLAFHSQKRNEPLMQLLLSKSKLTVDHIDPCGLSYLHIASSRALDKVKTLIRNGASVTSFVNSQTKKLYGYTALDIAILFSQVEIVEHLLNHGAEVDIPKSVGRFDTPLHLACTEQLKYFYGAYEGDGDNHLKTIDLIPPIAEANDWVSNRKDQMRIIELLLERGFSANVENYSGIRPLAAACNLPNSVSRIVHTYPKVYYDRILEEITIRRKMMIDILVRHGADINYQSRYKESILWKLFIYSNSSCKEKDIAETLLEKGANVDAMDRRGFTPLHLAVINLTSEENGKTLSQRDSAFIDLFLRFGANVNSKSNDHESILHSAVKCHYPERERNRLLIKLLKQPDVDLDTHDKNGNTPLHLAVHLCKPFCVQNLLDAGADINIENLNGHSPARLLQEILENSNDRLNTDKSDVHKIITNHLKKLSKLNYFVSKNNELCLTVLSKAGGDTTADSAIDNEIIKLKTVKVDNYTSLYAILMKDPRKMVNHAKNKVFEEMLLSPKLDNNFPLFCSFLRRQYRKGFSRGLILEPAKKSLQILTKVNWTDFCSDQILMHLSNDNLKNLTKSTSVNGSREPSYKNSSDLRDPPTKTPRSR